MASFYAYLLAPFADLISKSSGIQLISQLPYFLIFLPLLFRHSFRLFPLAALYLSLALVYTISSFPITLASIPLIAPFVFLPILFNTQYLDPILHRTLARPTLVSRHLLLLLFRLPFYISLLFSLILYLNLAGFAVPDSLVNSAFAESFPGNPDLAIGRYRSIFDSVFPVFTGPFTSPYKLAIWIFSSSYFFILESILHHRSRLTTILLLTLPLPALFLTGSRLVIFLNLFILIVFLANKLFVSLLDRLIDLKIRYIHLFSLAFIISSASLFFYFLSSASNLYIYSLLNIFASVDQRTSDFSHFTSQPNLPVLLFGTGIGSSQLLDHPSSDLFVLRLYQESGLIGVFLFVVVLVSTFISISSLPFVFSGLAYTLKSVVIFSLLMMLASFLCLMKSFSHFNSYISLFSFTFSLAIINFIKRKHPVASFPALD